VLLSVTTRQKAGLSPLLSQATGKEENLATKALWRRKRGLLVQQPKQCRPHVTCPGIVFPSHGDLQGWKNLILKKNSKETKEMNKIPAWNRRTSRSCQ
jgi:hypothetical protein